MFLSLGVCVFHGGCVDLRLKSITRMWYQYNIEPIPGWKMFRTASMLWEAYNIKHADGKTQRSKQEESTFNLITAKVHLLIAGNLCRP